MTTRFLIAVAVMLLAALCCGSATRKLGLTQTVGELLAGVVLGPTVIGQLFPQLERQLFPGSVTASIQLFGLVIVLVYVAQTGATIHHRTLELRGRKAAVIVASSTAIAVFSGLLVQRVFGELTPPGVAAAAFALFVAASLLVIAVPVLVRILEETGLTRSRVGGLALAIAIYMDFAGFTLATLATSLAKSDVMFKVLEGPALLLATIGACIKLRQWLPRLRKHEARSAVQMSALALAVAAASATGASTLVAAFIVGAILWRPSNVAAANGPLDQGSTVAAAAIVRALVPVYLVYSGLQVDLGQLLGQTHLLLATGVVLLLAVGGKVLASAIAARLLGLSSESATILAILTNTRGLTELLLISLGHSVGILSTDAYSVLFVVTVVTTAASAVLAPWAARRDLSWARFDGNLQTGISVLGSGTRVHATTAEVPK